jgi:hypothetical protein
MSMPPFQNVTRILFLDNLKMSTGTVASYLIVVSRLDYIPNFKAHGYFLLMQFKQDICHSLEGRQVQGRYLFISLNGGGPYRNLWLFA